MLEATGAALLYLLPYFCPLIFPGYLVLYHHRLHLGNMIGGLFLDGLFLLALGSACFWYLPRLHPKIRALVEAGLASFVLIRLTSLALAFLSAVHTSHRAAGGDAGSHNVVHEWVLWYASHNQICQLLGFILFAALASWKLSFADRMSRATHTALAGIAFSALWIVPQLLYLAFALHPAGAFDHSSAKSAPPPNERRIVWILFDELSQNLIFDHPPAGEQFPHFRQLSAQSTTFSNIVPIGLFTENVIPSLLADQQIDQIHSTPRGSLLERDEHEKEWIRFDPDRTLFGEASRQRWNPSVDGWYNPYCRLFAEQLTECSWTPDAHGMVPFEVSGASEEMSVFANALVLPRSFLTSSQAGDRNQVLRQDARDYQAVLGQAENLIKNGKTRFLFIHLPVPHPPGIYNRATHQLCACGNYLDNLVLADDTLGTLLKEIENTPWAAQTTVIVSSDHSWRVHLWQQDPGWTEEEQRVSGGRFDQRPVFLVHLPGEVKPNRVDASLPEFVEHDIVSAMLSGKIQSAEDLSAFLRTAPPLRKVPAQSQTASKAR